jgi:hypothetical protein
MPGMPAKCDRCGHIFETKEWGARGPFVQFDVGGFPVKCERCGGSARVIEGTFRPESDGSITPVSMPTASIATFLRLIMEKAKTSVPSEAELLESVESLSPELAEKIAPILHLKGVFFVPLVIAWIVNHLNVEIKATIDLNSIFNHAVTEIEKQSGGTNNSAPPSTSVTVNVEQHLSMSPGIEKPTKRRLRRIRGQTKRHPHKPSTGHTG